MVEPGTTKPKEKEFLYLDTHTYNTWKTKEDRLFYTYKELRKISSGCLGLNSILSVEEFINAPIEYMINEYWHLYGQKFNPAHADRRNVFIRNNTINLQEITNHEKSFWQLHKELGRYSPTITKSGISSNLKEDDFKKYLNPALADEYNALKRFVDAGNNLLDKGYASGSINLIRFNTKLKFEGAKCAIELNKFIE